jgi:hypothetical protein
MNAHFLLSFPASSPGDEGKGIQGRPVEMLIKAIVLKQENVL